MTDRFRGFTVALAKDVREDDFEAIEKAVRMIKGVLDVVPIRDNPDAWIADERARRELGEKLWQVLYPSKKENI